MDSGVQVDVFQFRDYRDYLAEVYRARKNSEYGFSYRAFSRRAKIRAPNYLKLVTEGARNLTATSAQRFAQALSLQGAAASYFCDLVAYNQAQSLEEKSRHFDRLQSYKRYRDVFRLDTAHLAYHSEWYIPAIRELIAVDGFRDDPKWIAHTLSPRISVGRAARALEILKRLGLASRGASGNWRQHEPLVATSEDAPASHNLSVFHRAMLERASEAIDRFPKAEREFGALTLAVDADLFARFKQRLIQLNEELLQESAVLPTGATRVIQLNFQLFPLTEDIGQKP